MLNMENAKWCPRGNGYGYKNNKQQFGLKFNVFNFQERFSQPEPNKDA
jgi:hypothetical protein